jgi:AcrR family transcriptional regulator
MSPKKNSNITDYKSEKVKPRRGRPAVPPASVLKAADALFADADSPRTITMDAIAARAGVGKGTLFRAFGSREGLLNALWAAKLAVFRDGVGEGALPRGPETSSRKRAVAFLDALLIFKLKNIRLIRALELGPGVLQSEHYKWMHGLLRHFIEDAAPSAKAGDAIFAGHALLAGLHIDLVEEMIAGGLSVKAIQQAQAAHARAVIDSAGCTHRS